MGSDYCKSGETFPNCDSYIKESVDKLISMGDKYDILCLQEVPKFDRSQQKATADKFINDFVLKYKYAIARKEGTNIAILLFKIRMKSSCPCIMELKESNFRLNNRHIKWSTFTVPIRPWYQALKPEKKTFVRLSDG